ncbi:MAG: hypothetical protein ACJ72U_11625, partial [Nitrososphaeraceae archaeon]
MTPPPKTMMTTTPTSRHKPDRFENIVSKYKARGLTVVADFLLTKARKSKRTAITFSFALDYLNKFIEQDYKGHNIQTILKPLSSKNKGIDVYKLLNSFVTYLQNDTVNGHDLAARSIGLYMVAARSYFVYNDIEISPSKFKYKISLPSVYREDEDAIDSNDIKEILHHCD